MMNHIITYCAAGIILLTLFSVPDSSGCEWGKDNRSPTTDALGGVYAPAGDDIFVVGLNGSAFRYNGRTWNPTITGTTRHLLEIWGSSGNDVFAVGALGTIVHFNGITWSVMSTSAITSLTGVWGFGSSDVFACGYTDTLLHYNGSSWSSMASGTGYDFLAIWGTSGTDLYACLVYSSFPDIYNYIYHYNGSSWSNMWEAYNAGGPASIWGTSSTNIYAVGGQSLHYDGVAWSKLAVLDNYDTVWGTSETDVYAVGNKISHYDGVTWTLQVIPGTDMRDVWTTDDCNAVTAGAAGNIYRCICPVPLIDHTGVITLIIMIVFFVTKSVLHRVS